MNVPVNTLPHQMIPEKRSSATPHWLPARKALAEWLLKEAEQRNRSLWEIVEGDADLSDFGVTAKTIAARPDIMELLPPGKTAGNAANRASYFFRKHQDGEKGTVRAWAEWPFPIPPRPLTDETTTTDQQKIHMTFEIDFTAAGAVLDLLTKQTGVRITEITLLDPVKPARAKESITN